MRILIALLVLVAGALAGCATPASTTAMVAAPPVPPAATAASPLARAVVVDTVTGGEPTSPLWVSKVGNAEFGDALRRSLEAAGLLAADPGAAKYDLRGNLITLSQPMIGLDMTVKSSVKYTVFDRATKRPVYDEIISADHTATFGDHPIGAERLRLASEGAIRKNIEAFLRDVVARVQAPPPPARPGRPARPAAPRS